MARLSGQERKEQRGRKAARDGVKKIHLDLGQIVEPVIKDLTELLQKIRCRNQLGGVAGEVGRIGDFLFTAKLLKGAQ